MMRTRLLFLLAFAFAASADPVRFIALDLIVETQHPLAAYQIELTGSPGQTTILSIEGGAPAAYRKAPYCDPQGIGTERLIIAAYSTDRQNLPSGTFRIARIHLQVEGDVPNLTAKLITAADAAGTRITPKFTLKPTQPEPN